MTANELLDAIGEAKEVYIYHAVNTRERVGARRRLHMRKTLLIAAVLALTLLLVGCAVVYVFSLQDKKISQTTGTRYFNEEGQRIPATEVAKDVISLFGYSGSPIQQAAKEWYEFEQAYDPDMELFPAEDSGWDFSSDYYNTYHCYTQEMVDKVDEITEKYGLKLLGTCAVVQQWDTDLFFEATGLEGLCSGDAQAEIEYGSGYFYPEGAFNLTVDITLNGEDSVWPHTVWTTVYYVEKDYFDPQNAVVEMDTYDQWMYTLADGTEVLLVMNPYGGMIFAEREDAYITVTIQTNTEWLVPTKEGQRPTRQVMEQLADVYDFSIRPHVSDIDAAREKLAASMEAWNAEQEAIYQEPDYSMYADYSDFLLDYNRWASGGYYTVMDINGDGVDDLLLGDKPNCFDRAMTIIDGEIVNFLPVDNGYLCQNGIIESIYSTGYSSYSRMYRSIEGYARYGDDMPLLERVGYDSATDTWIYSRDFETESVITKEEADVIQEKYTRIDLNMKPILDYPMDKDGTTLEEVSRQNTAKLSRAERMALYAEVIQRDQENAYVPSQYYCLKDITGDGIEELLLGYDADYFSNVYTISNGKLVPIRTWSCMNLCENGILEFSSISWVSESHIYQELDNNGAETVDYVCYSAYYSSWCRSPDENSDSKEIITEAEYNQIVDSYKRIALETKPISEFSSELE